MKKLIMVLLAALTCLCFVACAPANIEKAQEKMENAEYSVIVTGEDETELLYGEKAVGMIIASKGGILNRETLTAILFEDAASAKEFAEKDEERQVNGKWVLWGDESAIEDFTK